MVCIMLYKPLFLGKKRTCTWYNALQTTYLVGSHQKFGLQIRFLAPTLDVSNTRLLERILVRGFIRFSLFDKAYDNHPCFVISLLYSAFKKVAKFMDIVL